MKKLIKQLYFLKCTLDCIGFTVGVRRFGISLRLENKPEYHIGRRDRTFHTRYFEIYLWRFFVSVRWELKQPIDYFYMNGNYYQYQIDKVKQTVKVVPAIAGKEKLYYYD